MGNVAERESVRDEVRVTSLLVGVDVGLFLKSVGFGCTLVVDVPKVGVGASLESEDAASLTEI